jgi:hypothetical protein
VVGGGGVRLNLRMAGIVKKIDLAAIGLTCHAGKMKKPRRVIFVGYDGFQPLTWSVRTRYTRASIGSGASPSIASMLHQ